MATRLASHTTELTTLAAELNRLNARRDEIARRMQTLIASLVGDDTAPAVRSARGVRRVPRGGRPKGFKVSAATKAKLRAAWKRRRQASSQ
jgi:hypothetical protein